VWEFLQDRVYSNQIKDVLQLHQGIKEEWASLDQRVINSAIKEWCKRLWSCIAADGGHLKHRLHREHNCFASYFSAARLLDY